MIILKKMNNFILILSFLLAVPNFIAKGKEPEDEKSGKVCIVGDSGNAKTSLARALINKQVEKNQEIVTVNTEIATVREKGVRLQILDTCGILALREVVLEMYAKGSDIVLLAIDMTREYNESFNSWIYEIRKRSPNSEIILVGTKSLNGIENFNLIETLENQKQFIKTKAGEYNLEYFFIDAYYNSYGITELRNRLAEKIITKTPEESIALPITERMNLPILEEIEAEDFGKCHCLIL